MKSAKKCKYKRLYGKDRYSQIRRYSQIQNGLASAVNELASVVFYTSVYKEGGGNRAS